MRTRRSPPPKHPGGRPLPRLLRVALRGAGLRDLGDLATAVGLQPTTLHLLRSDRTRMTDGLRQRLAAALRIDVEHVDAIVLSRGRP